MKHSTKFQIYSQSDDGPGEYLGTINKSLRVLDVASGDERDKNSLQFLVDQHSPRLLVIPLGEHKKSQATTLSEIAPNPLPAKRRENIKKRPTDGKAKGSVFSKKYFNKNNTLQRPKSAFSQYSKSGNA